MERCNECMEDVEFLPDDNYCEHCIDDFEKMRKMAEANAKKEEWLKENGFYYDEDFGRWEKVHNGARVMLAAGDIKRLPLDKIKRRYEQFTKIIDEGYLI